MARKKISVFSISLLDMMFCAFGGVIVLMVIFSAMISEDAKSRIPNGLGMVVYMRFVCEYPALSETSLSSLTRYFNVDFVMDSMPVGAEVGQVFDFGGPKRTLGSFQGTSRHTLRGTDTHPVNYYYSVGSFDFEDYVPDSMQLALTSIGVLYDNLNREIPHFTNGDCFALTWIVYEPGFATVEYQEMFSWNDLQKRKSQNVPLVICHTNYSMLDLQERYKFSRP